MLSDNACMAYLNRRGRFLLTRLLTLAVSVTLFGGCALAASAQSDAAIPDYGLSAAAGLAGLPTGSTSPIDVVATIINTVVGLTGTLAVILVVYAGFLWMTAAGNEEKIQKAKKLLGQAVIGLAIIFSAYAIIAFTIEAFKRSSGFYYGGSTCAGPPPSEPCPPDTLLVCQNGEWYCGDVYAPPPPTCATYGQSCAALPCCPNNPPLFCRNEFGTMTCDVSLVP